MDSAVSEIAALLDSLNDSHTSLRLPPRNYTHDYGFKMKMFGKHKGVVVDLRDDPGGSWRRSSGSWAACLKTITSLVT